MNNGTFDISGLTAGQLREASRVREEIETLETRFTNDKAALEARLAKIVGGTAKVLPKAVKPAGRVTTTGATGEQRGPKSQEGKLRIALGQIRRRQGLAAATKQAKAWGIAYNPK